MPSTYLIKDISGNVVNTIVATEDFVSANFEHYELIVDSYKASEERREWRDSELARTDLLMVVSDYPYKEQLTAYRQALRDWPATEDFPETRPELGV